MQGGVISLFLFSLAALGLAGGMFALGSWIGPRRGTRVKQMPYESGVDPAHDTHRRFDVRFHLVAIAFLVFDVELLFLYPWAVASGNAQGVDLAVAEQVVSGRGIVFAGVMAFLLLLVVGFVYDWRKGLFRWR